MIESTFLPPSENTIIFSLIMATYNRKQEVENFILGLQSQNFNLDKVELIIIDQNKQGLLDDIVNKYRESLKIVHIRSNVLGSSVNRNIGINKSMGKIIAFPDDDCTFYDNTLSEVYNVLSGQDSITTVLGQIYDKQTGNKIIRNWPDNITKLTELNFFYLYSCITVFTKDKEALFDTRLGPSTLFGAYEDADYILSLVKKNSNRIFYFPNIIVNHPQLNISTMDTHKIINYGLGFGAFCKKNLSVNIFILYIKSLTFHLIMLIISILRCDFLEVKKRYFSISSRLRSFWAYSQI